MRKTTWMMPALFGILLFIVFFGVSAAGPGETGENIPSGTVLLRDNGIPVVTLSIDPDAEKRLTIA